MSSSFRITLGRKSLFFRSTARFASTALPNPYEILGVSPGDSEKDVRRKYRKLVIENHPDRGGSASKMAAINTAFKQIREGSARAPTSSSQAGAKPGHHGPRSQYWAARSRVYGQHPGYPAQDYDRTNHTGAAFNGNFANAEAIYQTYRSFRMQDAHEKARNAFKDAGSSSSDTKPNFGEQPGAQQGYYSAAEAARERFRRQFQGAPSSGLGADARAHSSGLWDDDARARFRAQSEQRQTQDFMNLQYSLWQASTSAQRVEIAERYYWDTKKYFGWLMTYSMQAIIVGIALFLGYVYLVSMPSTAAVRRAISETLKPSAASTRSEPAGGSNADVDAAVQSLGAVRYDPSASASFWGLKQ